MIDNESLPEMDDVQNQGPSEAELFDAVMKNSPIMDTIEEDNVPLPETELSDEDPVETVEEVDDQETVEAVSEEVEEEVEATEEEEVSEDAAEEAATEATTFTTDDLDLDAKVAVKIDGEESEVSFGDLIKGYSTEQSLSKKGRELGEARKQLESERTAALEEVSKLGQVAAATLQGTEQALAKEYHEIEAKIEKARKEGDSFEMSELKDKREQLQKNYWNARNRREQLTKQIEIQNAKVQEEAWAKQLDYFQKEIPNLIPDFNDKVANKIREFALSHGISPEVLNQITDPKIVKFVDDFRRLENGVSKGAAKRKVIPTKKVPVKKATPVKKKAQAKADAIRAKAFSENATADDQMDFLKQYASKSLNL